jgi:hypothetical protein
MYDLGYKELLADITARFGITLTCFDSGGGCLIWESRLETGDWLWITDYDAGINPLARRLALEQDGITIGWHVGIYANQSADYGDEPDSCTRLAGVEHHSATAQQLPDLIELALRGRARHEQHTFKADQPHKVEYGIRTY